MNYKCQILATAFTIGSFILFAGHSAGEYTPHKIIKPQRKVSAHERDRSLGEIKELFNATKGIDIFHASLPNFNDRERVIVWGQDVQAAKKKGTVIYRPAFGTVLNFDPRTQKFKVNIASSSGKTRPHHVPAQLITKIMPNIVWTNILLKAGIQGLRHYMRNKEVVLPFKEGNKQTLYVGSIKRIFYNEDKQLQWEVYFPDLDEAEVLFSHDVTILEP